MNVKCVSNLITVFPPGGGHYYPRVLSITVGNVYEVIENDTDNYYYVIRHDHGSMQSSFPTYLFVPTTEPVTPNPEREKEIADELLKNKTEIERRDKALKDQSITDAMDGYYCPEKLRARETARKNLLSALSDTFVQGISYL